MQKLHQLSFVTKKNDFSTTLVIMEAAGMKSSARPLKGKNVHDQVVDDFKTACATKKCLHDVFFLQSDMP